MQRLFKLFRSQFVSILQTQKVQGLEKARPKNLSLYISDIKNDSVSSLISYYHVITEQAAYYKEQENVEIFVKFKAYQGTDHNFFHH